MSNTEMTVIERIKWSAEVHGAAWAAKWARKMRYNIDDVLVAIGAPRVGVRQAARNNKK